MKVSKSAVAALAAGTSMLVLAMPAVAQRARQATQAQQQRQQQQQQPQSGERRYALSPEEQAALNPLIQANAAATAAQQAGQAPDWAAVQALLPTAQATAQSNDAKYLVARVQLAVGVGTNNLELQEQAATALLSNPATSPTEAATIRSLQDNLLNRRAEQAFNNNDFATAERIYRQLLQAHPGDQRLTSNLATVQQRMGNSTGVQQLVMQNIRAAEAAGRPAAEEDYRRALALAYQAHDRAQTLEWATKLAQNYATGRNWGDALRIYREVGNPSPALLLDAMRLARASGGLSDANEYLGFVQILDAAALPGEAKALIDEGIARGAIQANSPGIAQALATANRRIAEDRAGLDSQIAQARSGNRANLARAVGDALYGYGRYAEAADLYRAALTKQGADTDLLNLRLGAALAMAGQRAEAETALRAVSGQPADLARLWLAWLTRRTS